MIPSSVFPPPAPWLSVRQVVTAVLGISAGCAILWLVADSPRLEETELLGGTVLPSSELALMEAAFDRAQLTGYRTDGGRVYVPRDRQSSFMRALVDAEALPREFGGSLRRALESDSPWQSRSVQAERLRVAMQEELSLVICSMPGIERAAVLYDTAEQSRGPERKPVTTASVNVCTQADVTLDPTRVQAIRILVAASIAGLEAERVAVTDLRSGRVYTGPLETIATPHASDPAIARLLAQEQYLASKIRASLSFVQGVIVDVTITPQRVSAEMHESPGEIVAASTPTASAVAAANAPAEIEPVPVAVESGAAGEDVLVSVTLPDSFIMASRGGESIPTTDRCETIRDLVSDMLPSMPGRHHRVLVRCYPTPPHATTDQPPTIPPPTPSPESGAHTGLALRATDSAGTVKRFSPRQLAARTRQDVILLGGVVIGLLVSLAWWISGRRQQYERSSWHDTRDESVPHAASAASDRPSTAEEPQREGRPVWRHAA